MKDNSLTQRKRRDLYSLYLKGLREGKFTSVRDAGAWIVKQPAPCYYISPEHADEYIGKLMANQSLIKLNSSTRRAAWKLYRDYKEWLAKHPGTKRSRISVVYELVERPAPEFYMTSDAARRLLGEAITEAKRKAGWGD